MGNVILEMRGITKEFSGVKALDDVHLTVQDDEIHALVGENGAGKSTLMNILSGVYPHGTYSGQIFLEGNECSFRGIKDSERLGIVIIPPGTCTGSESFNCRKYFSRERANRIG